MNAQIDASATGLLLPSEGGGGARHLASRFAAASLTTLGVAAGALATSALAILAAVGAVVAGGVGATSLLLAAGAGVVTLLVAASGAALVGALSLVAAVPALAGLSLFGVAVAGARLADASRDRLGRGLMESRDSA